MLGYYFVSLRVLKQVEIRYTIPLSTLLAIPAGYLLALLWERGRAWRPLVAALLLGGLVYSGEVLHMLTHDARYQAEEWMQPRLEQGRSVEVYQRWTYLPRWQYSEGVSRVDFDDISIAGIQQRNPDLVVLSSKAVEGMVMYPNPDWRDGRGMMLESAANREFLDALRTGELGYRRVAEFKRPALIPRQLITSLDPSVVVFERIHEDRGAVFKPDRARLTCNVHAFCFGAYSRLQRGGYAGRLHRVGAGAGLRETRSPGRQRLLQRRHRRGPGRLWRPREGTAQREELGHRAHLQPSACRIVGRGRPHAGQ
jgi:hypothetical protein